MDQNIHEPVSPQVAQLGNVLTFILFHGNAPLWGTWFRTLYDLWWLKVEKEKIEEENKSSSLRDSNPRPRNYEASALPLRSALQVVDQTIAVHFFQSLNQIDVIPAPQLQFGGKVGSTVTSVVFKKSWSCRSPVQLVHPALPDPIRKLNFFRYFLHLCQVLVDAGKFASKSHS